MTDTFYVYSMASASQADGSPFDSRVEAQTAADDLNSGRAGQNWVVVTDADLDELGIV